MLDVDSIMARLSEVRKIFHSEADFQHAFAWQIHEAIPDCQIRLEFNPVPHEGRRMYLDIWLLVEKVAIELKYSTRKLNISLPHEHFALRDHNASDFIGYDFLKDIQRLEREVAENRAEEAFAILLTNDPSYWTPSQRTDTVGAAFRIHEGKRITGEMSWSDHAGQGTLRGRKTPIRLNGSYDMHYQDYSRFTGERYGDLRYLVVSVAATSEPSSKA